ncbi:hypothetical protein [Embleya sp. AB8]|uniref:hypothetical protein n=1 Tax=Embleya sp. AB8 TaxID=3156304 RepID=UPI003C76E1E8
MAISDEAARLLAEAKADYGTKKERADREVQARYRKGMDQARAVEAANMPGRKGPQR